MNKDSYEKELIDLVNKEQLTTAGSVLTTMGHRELGEAIQGISPLLPYLSDERYAGIKDKIIKRISNLRISIKHRQDNEKSEVVQPKKKEKSFSDMKGAMHHYVNEKVIKYEEQEEEAELHRKQNKKDEEDIRFSKEAVIFKEAKFESLASTVKISFTFSDVLVIGRIDKIEKALKDTHVTERLSMTEGVVEQALLLGIRKDYHLLPFSRASKRKHKKNEEGMKQWEINRNKRIQKKLVRVDQLATWVEEKIPGMAIVTSTYFATGDHCYYLILPYSILCSPCSEFRMGKLIPATKSWAILGAK